MERWVLEGFTPIYHILGALGTGGIHTNISRLIYDTSNIHTAVPVSEERMTRQRRQLREQDP